MNEWNSVFSTLFDVGISLCITRQGIEFLRGWAQNRTGVRQNQCLIFFLFTLSWFPYGKTGIIMDLLHLVVVSTELNQIKSLAQYLMCREHSGNCLQNHNQKVEPGYVESLFSDPFSLPAWWRGVPGCCRGWGMVQEKAGCWAQFCLHCWWTLGSSSPLWGLCVWSQMC